MIQTQKDKCCVFSLSVIPNSKSSDMNIKGLWGWGQQEGKNRIQVT